MLGVCEIRGGGRAKEKKSHHFHFGPSEGEERTEERAATCTLINSFGYIHSAQQTAKCLCENVVGGS